MKFYIIERIGPSKQRPEGLLSCRDVPIAGVGGSCRMDLRLERERVRSPSRQNLITGRAVSGKRLASPLLRPASSDSSATF